MSTTVVCPMCRSALDPEAQRRACEHCPLHRLSEGCAIQMVRCPYCGYHSLPTEVRSSTDTPAEPPVGAERARRASTATATGRRLDQLTEASDAVVTGFNGLSEHAMRRLMAYGLVPGARFKLLQRRPAYILRVGQTELALEAEIAASVYADTESGGNPP